MTAPQRHRGEVARAALTAAREAADAHGPHGVKLRAIAKQIGVSHPALVHHFGSRGDLLAEVAREGFGELALALHGSTTSCAARERFITVGATYAAFALQNPGAYRLMFHRDSVHAHWEGDIEPLAEACFEHLVDALAGAWPGIDPHAIATLAWSTMHGAIMLWLDGPLQQRRSGATSPLDIATSLATILPFPVESR